MRVNAFKLLSRRKVPVTVGFKKSLSLFWRPKKIYIYYSRLSSFYKNNFLMHFNFINLLKKRKGFLTNKFFFKYKFFINPFTKKYCVKLFKTKINFFKNKFDYIFFNNRKKFLKFLKSFTFFTRKKGRLLRIQSFSKFIFKSDFLNQRQSFNKKNKNFLRRSFILYSKRINTLYFFNFKKVSSFFPSRDFFFFSQFKKFSKLSFFGKSFFNDNKRFFIFFKLRNFYFHYLPLIYKKIFPKFLARRPFRSYRRMKKSVWRLPQMYNNFFKNKLDYSRFLALGSKNEIFSFKVLQKIKNDLGISSINYTKRLWKF